MATGRPALRLEPSRGSVVPCVPPSAGHPSDPTGRSVDPRNPAFRRPGSFPSPAERRRALAAAVTYLRCPVCAGPVYLGGSRLACGRKHSFDIARHGYANLTVGRTGPGTADTTVMVAARDRFLSGGHYQPLA